LVFINLFPWQIGLDLPSQDLAGRFELYFNSNYWAGGNCQKTLFWTPVIWRETRVTILLWEANLKGINAFGTDFESNGRI